MRNSTSYGVSERDSEELPEEGTSDQTVSEATAVTSEQAEMFSGQAGALTEKEIMPLEETPGLTDDCKW